jgi:choline dehydrogenase-like flavoprotein
MDHAFASIAMATVPGLDDQYHRGRKPNGTVIPRFVNVEKQETDFLRGYSFQGGSGRQGWARGADGAGIGAEFKRGLRGPGGWGIGVGTSIECLPRQANTISVDFNSRNRYGLPVTRLDLRWSDNEFKAAAHANREAVAMLSLLGGFVFQRGGVVQPPGTAIHEMGGACMGNDPRGSVTNAHNQLHDVPNVFCTDGAAMCSTGDRNPSLTYMALTVRAAAYATEQLRTGAL